MQVKELSSLAIILVIAGVTLGVGIQVNSEMGQKFDTVGITNETTTLTNKTCITTMACQPVTSISQIANTTYVVASGNYSICGVGDSKGINLTYIGSGATAGSSTVSYDVTYSGRCSYAYRAAANSTLGVGEMSSWVPTIALVLAAAMVMGVIFKSFSGSGGGI